MGMCELFIGEGGVVRDIDKIALHRKVWVGMHRLNPAASKSVGWLCFETRAASFSKALKYPSGQ
jgi:hypothetical protein